MSAMLSIVVSFLIFGSTYAKLPEVKCSIKDRKLDECMKDSINSLIPQLSAEGIPEVQLAPLDPFTIKELIIEPKTMGKIGHSSGRLAINDLVIKGLKGTAIMYLGSTDLEKLVNQTLEMKLSNPKLLISGKYKGAINVESMEISGDGEFKLQLKGVKAVGKLVADTKIGQDNKTYFTVKSVDINPTIDSLKVNATNLFNKNTALADFVLNLVNNNWQLYYDKVFMHIKPDLEQLIKDQINLFTTKVSTDKIVGL